MVVAEIVVVDDAVHGISDCTVGIAVVQADNRRIQVLLFPDELLQRVAVVVCLLGFIRFLVVATRETKSKNSENNELTTQGNVSSTFIIPSETEQDP